MNKQKLRPALLLLLLLPLWACDPNHKEQCEWYLVPEPKHIDLVEEGWVSLCARNYVINQEKCYLKATLEYSKAVFGKSFRYSQMKVRQFGLYPREVESIKVCKPEGAEERRLQEHPNKPLSEVVEPKP